MSSLQPVPAAVVYDINILVTAAASGNSPFRSWPSPPPVSGNASADCLGMIADAAEFALWLSPHIITNIDRILAQLFKWAQPQIDAYLRAIVMAAEHSGGGIVADVPRTVHDCPDHEDNLILDLAAEVGALLIVSNDTDLLSMSPWRGTPIIEPAAFAAKVDAMRRHARRRRRYTVTCRIPLISKLSSAAPRGAAGPASAPRALALGGPPAANAGPHARARRSTGSSSTFAVLSQHGQLLR